MEMQGKHFENCKLCNKVFYATDSDIKYCSDCALTEETTFREVRDFLYSHPKSNAKQINAAIGTPVEKILEYVKAGRITSIAE